MTTTLRSLGLLLTLTAPLTWASTAGFESRVFIDGDSNTMNGSTKDLRSAKQAAGTHRRAFWFKRGGEAFIIIDAGVLDRIKQASAPVDALGTRMGELGERMGTLGAAQGALGARMGLAAASDDESAASLERQMHELETQMNALSSQMSVLERQMKTAVKQAERDVAEVVADAERAGLVTRLEK